MSKSDDRETVEKNNEMREVGDSTISPEPLVVRAGSSGTPPGGGDPPRAARPSGGGDGGGGRSGTETRRPNLFQRAGQFIDDIRAEMRRVSWPTATEVKNTTIITIIAVIFFAIYFYAVDHSWTFLIAQLERFVAWLVGG